MKKIFITAGVTLMVVFSMGNFRTRYNPLPFGDMTATNSNLLIGDGTKWQSADIVVHESDLVFHENVMVTY